MAMKCLPGSPARLQRSSCHYKAALQQLTASLAVLAILAAGTPHSHGLPSALVPRPSLLPRMAPRGRCHPPHICTAPSAAALPWTRPRRSPWHMQRCGPKMPQKHYQGSQMLMPADGTRCHCQHAPGAARGARTARGPRLACAMPSAMRRRAAAAIRRRGGHTPRLWRKVALPASARSGLGNERRPAHHPRRQWGPQPDAGTA